MLLLAQQEVEKGAIRDVLLQKAGPLAVEGAVKSAERHCMAHYGVFISDYEGNHHHTKGSVDSESEDL